MHSNIYEDPDLTVNVRFNKGVRQNRGESQERVVDIYESADTFTDRHRVNRPKQGREAQTQEQRPAVKRGNYRTAASVLGLLCFLLLAGVIVLSKLYISEMSKNSVLSQKEKQTSHNNLSDSFCHGWKRFQCSCYYKSTEKKNWTDSRTDCQSNGAELVMITTKEQHDFVRNLTENQPSWIGLQSVIMASWKKEWQWVDGTKAQYLGFRKDVDITQLPDGHKVYMDEKGMWEYKDSGIKHWICERAIS